MILGCVANLLHLGLTMSWRNFLDTMVWIDEKRRQKSVFLFNNHCHTYVRTWTPLENEPLAGKEIPRFFYALKRQYFPLE